jgi:phosphoglycolate phosphatase-like HAD superfamily hydrolase
MALKVCVFDFDGTLVDTMGGFADIAADVLEKRYGLPFDKGRSQYLHTSGIPFFQQLEIICPGGDHNQACAEEFESRKLEGFFECAPGDATILGLKLLHGAGFKLVVSSNNFQHNVDAFLDRHHLPLDLALGFDHQGSEKGRPHFEKVQAHFEVTAEEVLFCGDSLKDGERAGGCGIRFVGMTGTFTREQFQERFPGILTVDTILELAERLVHKQM